MQRLLSSLSLASTSPHVSSRFFPRVLAGALGLALLFGLPLGATGPAAEPAPAEALAPLAAYVGKTWRGEFADSTPERPKIDVARWEWALNGQAIRILHSINDGEYGGETLLLKDPEGDELIFYYFTTGGFYTQGTARVEDGNLVVHEKVTGSPVTEVRGTSERLPDGRLRGTAEYKRNGEWTEGHTVTYEEAPGAEVVFRNPK